MIIMHSFWRGVRHIFSPSVTTKHELIEDINHIYDLNITVNAVRKTPPIHRDLETMFVNPILKSLFEQIEELKEFNLNEKVK